MDAEKILKTVRAEDLFGAEPAEQRKRFRALVAEWHPDHNPDPRAGEVLARLMVLRDRIGSPAVASMEHIILARKDGGEFKLNFLRRHVRDGVQIYVQQNSLTTIWPEGFERLAGAEASRIAGFRYADDKMKAQMTRFLPKLKRHEELAAGAMVALERESGDILLADVLAHVGTIPSEHAAWITSGLLNICCWLQWSGVMHGAISPDTVVIDPVSHEVKLLGGWGFATPHGERPAVLPGRTVDRCPRVSIKSTMADVSIDLEMVRMMLCEMVGGWDRPTLIKLGVPAPIADWATMPSGVSAYEDYKAWGDALKASWGARKFIIWDLKVENVYQ